MLKSIINYVNYNYQLCENIDSPFLSSDINRTVNIWNNLTSNLKTLKTISSFKFHLKSKLMEEFLT